MLRGLRILLSALGLMALIFVAVFGDLIADPKPFFTYHTTVGWLTLYSDQPYDDAAGQKLLNDVARRLATSPLDDLFPHAIYVADAPWKQRLFFLGSPRAAAVDFYPATSNVFLRRSDVDRDVVYGPSGRAAAPPRTLAFFAAREIAHSLTGERLGAASLWNFLLPPWVREGYADYVGLGGQVDVDDLYRRYKAGDPGLDDEGGGDGRSLMLVAYMLTRQHWTVNQLLDTRLTGGQAQAVMDRGMAAEPLRGAVAAAPVPPS